MARVCAAPWYLNQPEQALNPFASRSGLKPTCLLRHCPQIGIPQLRNHVSSNCGGATSNLCRCDGCVSERILSRGASTTGRLRSAFVRSAPALKWRRIPNMRHDKVDPTNRQRAQRQHETPSPLIMRRQGWRVATFRCKAMCYLYPNRASPIVDGPVIVLMLSLGISRAVEMTRSPRSEYRSPRTGNR